MHGDLKPHNILMTGSAYDCKLSDFGISRILTKNYGFAFEQSGTLPYCSPEVVRGEGYNQKTDVWALGCIIYELCAHRRCFDDPMEHLLKESILNHNVPQLPLRFSKELNDLFLACMQKCQYERPTVREILSRDTVRVMASKLGIYLPLAKVT